MQILRALSVLLLAAKGPIRHSMGNASGAHGKSSCN